MKLIIILSIILFLVLICFLINTNFLSMEEYTFADYDYVTRDGKNVNMFPSCFCSRNINII